jgi:phosphatidylserine/phosphatidylglycerophosphate/cardiolipin synthase-like enzyme
MENAKMLSLSALLAFSSLTQAQEVGRHYNLDQIQDYFNQAGLESIQLKEKYQGTTEEFVFKNDSHWLNRFEPADPNVSPFSTEDFRFKFDWQSFMSQSGAKDLQTARQNFYKDLAFISESGQTERPHSYMGFWTGLFHPPITKLTAASDVYDQDLKKPNYNEIKSEYIKPSFQKSIDEYTKTELTAGNKVKLLANNKSYKEKMRFIQEAKDFMFFSVLYFQCDDSTKDLIAEMKKATDRGVEIRFIAERAYTPIQAGCLHKFKKAGVKFMGISDLVRQTAFFSGVFHNKVWIRDGEEAILGGMNLLRAENTSTGFNHLDRDTDVHMQGPLVTDLLEDYDALWNKYRKKAVTKVLFRKFPKTDKYKNMVAKLKAKEYAEGKRGQENYEGWLSNPETRHKGLCRLTVQRAGAQGSPITRVLQDHLKHVQENVFIMSPNITHDVDLDMTKKKDRKKALRNNNIMVQKLKEKALEGKKIKIITNSFEGGEGELSIVFRDLYEKARAKDKKNSRWERMTLNRLFKYSKSMAQGQRVTSKDFDDTDNIEVWNYFQYNHSKVWLFDNHVTHIGSYNLDYHSSDRSHEAGVFCLDKGLADEVRDQFALDLINSIPLAKNEK